MTPADADRQAFKEMMRQEDFESDNKTSLRKHWAGTTYGFADERVQARWRDFCEGVAHARAAAEQDRREWRDQVTTLLARWDRRGTKEHSDAYRDSAIELLRSAIKQERSKG